jgi:mycothiol synthase
VNVAEVDDLSARQVFDVLELRNSVAASSRTSPLSDHVVAAVKGQAPGRHFLQTIDTSLVGYAHLETSTDPVAEVLVGDAGDVTGILDAVTRAAGSSLRIWTRGDAAPMNDVLPAQGFRLVRTLLQLRCPLDGSPLADAHWPDGVTVRSFAVGADEETWLEVNNAAFAAHPEQASWTLDDVRAREGESWFDPGGFFLAEVAGRVVGFHWTKVHVHRPTHRPLSAPAAAGTDTWPGGDLGEVYVIGVHPSMQGKGLGEALLLHGLHHLRDRGLSTVLLYVEADNRGAIALYERHGFTKWDADRMFFRAG